VTYCSVIAPASYDEDASGDEWASRGLTARLHGSSLTVNFVDHLIIAQLITQEADTCTEDFVSIAQREEKKKMTRRQSMCICSSGNWRK
jgi:hypothetical protein